MTPDDPASSSPPFLDELRWSDDGLIPAIVQESDSGEILMMAWMDRAALIQTLQTGQTHFYSRSRQTAWHKGGTSGHVQQVAEIRVDCDADVLLILARQTGGACHEGYRSCFFRKVDPQGQLKTIAERVFEPGAVYGS